MTMYQRSSTHVVSTKNGFKTLFAGAYEEGGPPTDTVDRIAAAYPNVMSVELRRRITAKIAEDDKCVFFLFCSLLCYVTFSFVFYFAVSYSTSLSRFSSNAKAK